MKTTALIEKGKELKIDKQQIPLLLSDRLDKEAQTILYSLFDRVIGLNVAIFLYVICKSYSYLQIICNCFV